MREQKPTVQKPIVQKMKAEDVGPAFSELLKQVTAGDIPRGRSRRGDDPRRHYLPRGSGPSGPVRAEEQALLRNPRRNRLIIRPRPSPHGWPPSAAARHGETLGQAAGNPTPRRKLFCPWRLTPQENVIAESVRTTRAGRPLSRGVPHEQENHYLDVPRTTHCYLPALLRRYARRIGRPSIQRLILDRGQSPFRWARH